MKTIDDEIREEAYFTYEVRKQYDIPGTQDGDWIEAERKIKQKLTDDIFGKNNCKENWL